MTSFPSSWRCAIGAAAVFASLDASAFDQAAVQREVDGMNQSLPAMVSPVLREEPVQFTGKTLMYTFTHIGRSTDEIAKQNLNVSARSYLLARLCADADTRDMMREGLTFTFSYVDEKTARRDGAVLTEADCAATDKR